MLREFKGTWTQWSQMQEKAFKRSNTLINKIIKNPNSKHAARWKQEILDLGQYDSEDINYLTQKFNP